MRWTMPISRSVGTTMNTSQSAASIVTQVAAGRRRRISVADDIAEEEPPRHSEHDIAGREHAETGERGTDAGVEDGAGRGDGADQQRHEEREEEERQEEVAGARPGRHRREERPERRDAEVPEEEDEDEPRQPRQQVDVQEEARERHDDRLRRGEDDDVRGALPGVEGAGVERRRQEPGEAVVLALEEKSALHGRKPRENERHPEDRGQERRGRVRPRVVGDAEDDQEEDAHHEHAGHALARPPLDAEVLREDRERGAHHARRTTTAAYAAAITACAACPSCVHAMRPRWRIARRVATGAARSTSWVVNTTAWPAVLSAAIRSSRAVAASRSSPLNGSSMRRRSGRWRRARASARRWLIPRE